MGAAMARLEDRPDPAASSGARGRSADCSPHAAARLRRHTRLVRGPRRCRATYRVVVDRQHIVRPPPQTVEPAVDQIFDRYYEVDAPEEALVEISGASVATNGLLFLPDGSLVGEAVTHLREFRPGILANQPAYARPLPRTVRALEGNYYSLMFANHDNYYHWHHDVVMRLRQELQRHRFENDRA